MHPHRIQRERTKGWRMPLDTLCVTRPSRWGNPFHSGDRRQDVCDFERWLVALPAARYRAFLRPLVGKHLACYCPLDGQPCHADTLLRHAAALTMIDVLPSLQ